MNVSKPVHRLRPDELRDRFVHVTNAGESLSEIPMSNQKVGILSDRPSEVRYGLLETMPTNKDVAEFEVRLAIARIQCQDFTQLDFRLIELAGLPMDGGQTQKRS